MTYSKILIAIDNSEYSMKAAKKGLELSQQLNVEAALIYVIDTSKAMGNIDAGIFPDDAMLILKKEAEQTLDDFTKMFGGTELMKFMPEGHPEKEILTTSDLWQADLLVIGTHGRTGLLHLLMGSVAEHIIQHSKIPVMVVPAK